MAKWLYLVGAIVLEVSATLSLRQLVDHAGWIVLVLLGYGGAFLCLALLLRAGAPIGLTYGVWAASGVALTAVLALAQGLGIVVSLPLWERCGRRRLLIPSALAAAAAMACVALAFWAGIERYKYVGLFGVVTYLIGFGMGLSSGPWVVNAEIYPTRLRGLGQASACTANWAANYVVAATFLSLCKALGQASTFALLSCISLAGAAWLRGALPETAGRSLEEIEDLFRARSYGQVRTADEDEARNPLGDDEAM